MDQSKGNSNHIVHDFLDLISLHDAAIFCGLSQDHLRRLVEGNKLWGIKIGRNWN